MNYYLKRSKRKTISIQIQDNGTVLVKAPIKCNIKIIENFIVSKQKWIEDKLKIINDYNNKYLKFYNLDKILILGEDYDIVDYGSYYKIGENIIKHTKVSNKKNIIKKFIFFSAEKYILDRLKYLSDKLNLTFCSAKIISAKKKWGSCNNKKELKFNYKLFMLPKRLIDYVICHELCHLIELNHSNRFWELLNKLGFNKSEIRRQIKQYGFVLNMF